MKSIKAFEWMAHLLGDLFRCFVVPFIAAIMPRRIAGPWLMSASRWLWMFPGHEQASAAINRCFSDRAFGFEQVALTMLNESATAWKLLIGRRLHVRQHTAWPSNTTFVAAGGHFGSGLSVLWSLKQAGLRPSFILRRPSPSWGWRRSRPIYYYWSVLRFKLIERLCDGNLIVTGGARRKLTAALKSGAVTPVILFDTPCAPGDSDWRLPIGNTAVTLPVGARDAVTDSASTIVLFLPFTNVREVDAELYVERLDPDARLAEEFPQKFGHALAESPAEWHFWPIIEPYLYGRS